MGTVVPPDQPTDGAPATQRRTALVLGGGGLSGGAYGVGALRAIDLLSSGRATGDFDVYVGTSSGSFLAALAANGVTSRDMLEVLLARPRDGIRALDVGTLLAPNLGGLARAGVALPRRALGAGWRLARTRDRGALLDALLGALPPGLFDTRGIERYLRETLGGPGRSDDFRRLERDLYLVATDLDTCERIVFGEPGWDDVPISRAVAASTALPVLYAPVRVGDRELIDGGVVSTTNLDVAVAHGATLVIVVNPLVPYRNDGDRGAAGGPPRRVSELGFSQVAYQCFKLLAHQRLHDLRGLWEERHPGVDVVLVEPDRDDELMFETSPISYASRSAIAWHGFRSVVATLTSSDALAACARHGIQLDPARLEGLPADGERVAWDALEELAAPSALG